MSLAKMDHNDEYYRIPNEALITQLGYRRPGDIHHMDENRAGFPLYDGNLYEYKEWCFKVNIKLEAIGWEEEDAHRRRQLASGLVTALRGQAQKIAEEIGDKALITDDFNGFEMLKERLEDYRSAL